MDPVIFARKDTVHINAVYGGYDQHTVEVEPIAGTNCELTRIVTPRRPAYAISFDYAVDTKYITHTVGNVLTHVQQHWPINRVEGLVPLFCTLANRPLNVAPDKVSGFGCARCPYELMCINGQFPPVESTVI